MTPEELEELQYLHEHELPRKRSRGYDDINTPTNEGGDLDE